jgi:hypothetical protein
MFRSSLACSLLLALGAAGAVDAATIAVLPLRAEGLQLNEANRLNLLLRARAGTRGGFTVQGEQLTTQLVEASQALGVDCDLNAVACGVEVGTLADVEFVLLGRATRLGAPGAADARFGVEVQLVDVKAGSAKRVIGQIAIAGEPQTADVDALANALFGKDPLPALTLRVPDGASVRLDGALLGTTPLPQIAGLLPGAHVVVVEKKAHLPNSTPFSIAYGEAADLEVVLVVDPEAEREVEVLSPLQVGLPFVLAGVGGAVALAGGGLMVGGAQPWFALGETQQLITEEEAAPPVSPQRLAELNARAVAHNKEWTTTGLPLMVGGGVAIALGIGAVVGGIVWGVNVLEEDAALRAAQAQGGGGGGGSSPPPIAQTGPAR